MDKANGTDIISLAEIQKIRAGIARGETKDDIGFAPDMSDWLKACADLEKSLRIAEEQKQKREMEEARQNGRSLYMISHQILLNRTGQYMLHFPEKRISEK